MARLDDLMRQVQDEGLRSEMQEAYAASRRRQHFGLVFEEHVPETVSLVGLPVRVGSTVELRSDPGSGVYRVTRIKASTAILQPIGGGEWATESRLKDLLVVKRFGEAIYPSLTTLGAVERSAATRPHHAVINGENFHAAQLLGYMYEEKVDCIYLDPPYNTGASVWKYNNRYVDDSDYWRHSKWLSFMEKRLRLAKRLLKPNGVLIVTIDEHEVHHLGMLLEDKRLFGDAYRQMVTIVINPKGVTQGRFSRVDEYAFFCFLGDAGVLGRGDDLLSPAVEAEPGGEREEAEKPRWKGLLRSGTNARRADRKNMFYPVLIDEARGAVVGTGEPLPFDEEPDFTKTDGYSPAWPVRRDGTLGNWGVGHTTLRTLIKKGYVGVGGYDENRKTWALSYLGQEAREQIESGVLDIVSYDEARNVVDVRYSDVANRRLKTVWHRSRHDAGVGGTDVIRSLLGFRAFSFPKSVYAVQDCLSAVLSNRPDALILDYFAGSGTTLHATCLLNARDGGRRRCILVTNNEVDPEDTARLRLEGLFRGDPEFERHGIFEQATRPRVEAAVTGRRPDGSVITGEHLGGRPYSQGFDENVTFYRLDYLDPDEVGLGRQFKAILPALWLSAGGIGPTETPGRNAQWTMPEGSTYGVLFHESRFQLFLRALESRPDVTHVWLVTDSDEAFAEMQVQLPRSVVSSMLYRDYLRNFMINTDRNI